MEVGAVQRARKPNGGQGLQGHRISARGKAKKAGSRLPSRIKAE
jgi:hypothetical protein